MRRNDYHGRDGRLKIFPMMYGSSYLSRIGRTSSEEALQVQHKTHAAIERFARTPPPLRDITFTWCDFTCPVAEKLPFFCKGPATCACHAPCLSRKTSSAPARRRTFLLGCANFDAKMVAVRADIQPPCRAYSRTPERSQRRSPLARACPVGAENVLFVQPGHGARESLTPPLPPPTPHRFHMAPGPRIGAS